MPFLSIHEMFKLDYSVTIINIQLYYKEAARLSEGDLRAVITSKPKPWLIIDTNIGKSATEAAIWVLT